MVSRFLLGVLGVLAVSLLFASRVLADDPQYVLKVIEAEPPKELKEPIRKEMGRQCYQVFNPKGELHCEFWLRGKVPCKAAPEQVKNGLSYKDLEQTVLVGALKLGGTVTDYRKQDIVAGVYTLRLAFQPQDGDHMGTAPYPEFFLVTGAAHDESPGPLDIKKMQEKSAETLGGNHPGVFLLFPNPKPEDGAKLVKEMNDHWIVKHYFTLDVEGKPARLGFGLTVVGRSATAPTELRIHR